MRMRGFSTLFVLLSPFLVVVVALVDFSIEWIDATITVLDDERTALFHLQYTAGNLPECVSGDTESCTFVPSVHTVIDQGCSPEPVSSDSVVVRPVDIAADSIHVYIEIDILEAPEFIVDTNEISVCVQLDSYGANGNFHANSVQVIQGARVTVTGTFTTGPATTEALQTRDTASADAFQIPVLVFQCSAEVLQYTNDGVFVELCLATSYVAVWTVSSFDEVTLERPATSATQSIITGGTLLQETTVAECGSDQCRLRFRIDPTVIGSSAGTLSFYGVAVVSFQGGTRMRKLAEETRRQSFDYKFEYDLEAASALQSAEESSAKADERLYQLASTSFFMLLLCFG